MAADTTTSRSDAPPCPDPSAHEHTNKLSAQASTAALMATGGKRSHSRNSSIQSESILGPDGKLSSKSAATSLKYASPQDLPSFPSSGNVSGSAGKAAMLAKDYKMKELWQPEQSAAGSKAALLAANKGAKLDLWEATATAEGHSAATLAMRNKGLSPEVFRGNTAENKSKALMAATGATQQSRSRATSTPVVPPPRYPDEANAGKNALSAATASHGQSRNAGWNDPANQTARVTHLGENVSGKMFTSSPDWQYEEDKHQAALRASAITMAQSLYANQNRQNMMLEPDGSDLAGAVTATRNAAIAHPDVRQEALQYINLQDTAHRLAAERLAKIDKDLEGKRFREHYGYGDKPQKTLSSRMSVRSAGTERRGRQRATSDTTRGRYDSDSESEDERQAGRIRAQMAGLRNATGQVDAKKQQEDRAKLLAVAEKRVSARMADMDSKVYRDTGKVSPAMIEDWEAKAREKAERQRQERVTHPGKTHIGGGQFMDQSEIEAIAAARLKPTLEEIDATAASKRQHDEEMRIEKDKQQTAKLEEKIKKAAIQDDIRESSKRERAAEKAQEKARKDEEKARKEEEKRAAQAEQRKSREAKRDTVGSSVVPAGGAPDEATDNSAATDGREKHQSALARLKAKFRTTGSHDKKTETAAVGDSTDKGAAVSSAATVGAVTGATQADLDKRGSSTESLDAQQATHAVAEDTQDSTTPVATTAANDEGDTTYKPWPVSPLAEDEKRLGDSSYEAEWKAGGAAPTAATTVVPTVPIEHDDSESDADGEESLHEERQSRPTFTQTGSVSGFASDTVPTVSHGERMATLERHISNIPDSEGSSLSSDDEDWNEERSKPVTRGSVPDQEPSAVALAPGPVTPFTPGPATHETEAATADRWFPPAAEAGVGGATAATTLKSEAEHPPRTMEDVFDNKDAGLQTPEVPRNTSAPDTASTLAIPPSSATSSPAATSDTLKQKLKGEEDLPAVVGAPAIPLQGQPVSSGLTSQGQKPARPIKTETKTESGKEGKGVRGFLSKIRSKGSRSEKSPGTITAGSSSKYDDSKYENKPTKAGDKPSVDGTSSERTGSDSKPATATADKQVTESQAPVTTSTAATIPPVDTGAEFSSKTVEPTTPAAVEKKTTPTEDVSSDEDNTQRGRMGERSLSKKLGFGRNNDAHVKDGKLHKPAPGTESDLRRSSVTDDDTDNFEEARDHFDESLAPPPAFSGSKKSESPVRETKFKEDV